MMTATTMSASAPINSPFFTCTSASPQTYSTSSIFLERYMLFNIDMRRTVTNR
jgi:hypothetical protein